MSKDQKLKPPQIKLDGFQMPEGMSAPARPSFYSEESTMITALSEQDRARIARGSSSPTASAPPATQAPLPRVTQAPSLQHRSSLNELKPLEAQGQSQMPELSSEDAFEGTEQISPDDLELLKQAGGFASPASSQGHAETANSDPLASFTPEQSQSSGLIVVFNTRGGVGGTTLAVNLAGSAQAYGKHVALVDLDLQLGSVSSMLEGKPLERSLAELVMEASESVNGQIKSAIDERSGIHLIAQEGRIGEIGMVTPERLPRFFDAVKAQHGLVIVDGVRSFSDQAVTALDAADVILLVISQDIPALRSARQVLSLFKRLGYDRSKVRIVINRYLSKNPLTVAEIEERLDHEVYETLNNDFPFVSSLIEQGRLAREVNLKHPVTQGFDRLAARLLGLNIVNQKKGLFSFLSKFKKS